MTARVWPASILERLDGVASTTELLADLLLDRDEDNNVANVLRLVTKELDEIRAIVSDAEEDAERAAKTTNAEAAE